jgi:hypothetical protein
VGLDFSLFVGGDASTPGTGAPPHHVAAADEIGLIGGSVANTLDAFFVPIKSENQTIR